MKTTVGNFIDQEMVGVSPDSSDNYIKIADNIQVLTVSQDEKIEWKYVKELSKHPVNGDLIKVTTESGRSVTTTLAHSHLKKQGSIIVPILGYELKIGDRIPVIKKSPKEERNVTSLFIQNYIDYANDDIESIVMSTNFHTKRINTIIFNSNDTVKLILITSFIQLKGYLGNKLEILEDYQMLLSQYGILTCIHRSPLEGYDLFIQQKYTTKLSELLKVEVPIDMIIDDFEKDHVTDPCVLAGKCSIVECIIYIIYYTIYETDEDYDKEICIANCIKNYKYTDIKQVLGFDFFEVLKQIIETYKDEDVIRIIQQLDCRVDKDIIWDKIVTLELIAENKYEYKYVYDFSVQGNETFALFSGIVVHNTLNTFHKAGQSESSVTVGVPRFQELLNATKSPRMVNCKIFFKEGNDTIQDLRNTINHNFVALTLKELSESIHIQLNKEHEWWYETFKILYNDTFNDHFHCLSIKLNKKLMFKYRLTIEDIANKIEAEYDDLKCVFSPPSIAQLDIFVDVTNIKFTEKQLLFVTEENQYEIYLDECVQPILEKMNICGIPGIFAIYYTRTDTEPQEWYIETDGSNFRKLLGHPLIDMTRLQSNNVWDIYESLGVEAARQFLIDEFLLLMEGINSCHVKLLVDKMTFCGNISSITRYTLRKDESGQMCRASFEESMDHYIKSSFNCEIEKTRGVSASIICGKRANIGTGFMELKVDMNMLPVNNRKSVFFKTDGVVEGVGKPGIRGHKMK